MTEVYWNGYKATWYEPEFRACPHCGSALKKTVITAGVWFCEVCAR